MINTDLRGDDWKAFKRTMRAAGYTVRGSGALTFFEHQQTRYIYCPFNVTGNDGMRESWVTYAEAGETPAAF